MDSDCRFGFPDVKGNFRSTAQVMDFSQRHKRREKAETSKKKGSEASSVIFHPKSILIADSDSPFFRGSSSVRRVFMGYFSPSLK